MASTKRSTAIIQRSTSLVVRVRRLRPSDPSPRCERLRRQLRSFKRCGSESGRLISKNDYVARCDVSDRIKVAARSDPAAEPQTFFDGGSRTRQKSVDIFLARYLRAARKRSEAHAKQPQGPSCVGFRLCWEHLALDPDYLIAPSATLADEVGDALFRRARNPRFTAVVTALPGP